MGTLTAETTKPLLSVFERPFLDWLRFELVRHGIGGISRVQTVSAERDHQCVRAPDRGPGLVNTSFNVEREPMLSSPSDALNTCFSSGIDTLALRDYIVGKE